MSLCWYINLLNKCMHIHKNKTTTQFLKNDGIGKRISATRSKCQMSPTNYITPLHSFAENLFVIKMFSRISFVKRDEIDKKNFVKRDSKATSTSNVISNSFKISCRSTLNLTISSCDE